MFVKFEDVKEDYARKDAEIAKLKDQVARLSKGMFFSSDEFMTLATFCMTNDQPEHSENINIETLHSILDQIAINQFDLENWITAYHEL